MGNEYSLTGRHCRNRQLKRNQMRPILFNTDMVQAILEGSKTVTRRVAFPNEDLRKFPRPDNPDAWWFRGRAYTNWDSAMRSPQGVLSLCKYKKGDILYVRETWKPMYPDETSNIVCGYMYKADDCGFRGEEYKKWYDAHYPSGKDWFCPGIWRPSIHMPKEAARLFLRVTAVRVERLQDITEDGARSEGCYHEPLLDGCDDFMVPALYSFQSVWDSTVRKTNRDTYGWDANPWVWVIEFELISKEAELVVQKGGD